MSGAGEGGGPAGRTVAVMQPYFCPYVGYFQLVAAADLFVVYDDVQFTKKGWMNRNRILQQDRDAVITVPVRDGPATADVRDREVAADFDRDRLLNRIREAYRKAPAFAETFPLVEALVRCPERNLFAFLHHSLERLCRHLELRTPLVVSSTVPVDRGLRGQDRVIALCRALGATRYLNPIGGVELYSREAFARAGLELRFLRPRPLEYPQLGGPFVPWLSIVDLLMFNPRPAVQGWLAAHYDLE